MDLKSMERIKNCTKIELLLRCGLLHHLIFVMPKAAFGSGYTKATFSSQCFFLPSMKNEMPIEKIR